MKSAGSLLWHAEDGRRGSMQAYPRPGGRRWRAFITALIVSACLHALTPAQEGALCAGKPEARAHNYRDSNVILVSFDALQAKHVHSLGYPRETTPAIDAVAGTGFSFANNISVSSWTVPSTMTWFTGVFPSEHKLLNKYSLYEPPAEVFANLKKLAPHLKTLAELLRESGYATAGFTGDAGVSGLFGYDQGFDVYADDRKFGGLDYSAPHALEWIKENRHRKFFVFLHGYDAHGQCVPSQGYDYRYVDPGYDYRYRGTKKEQEALREEGLRNGAVELREDDVRFWRAVYDEKINRADERFKLFLDEIAGLGLMKNTLLVLTSDHGTEVFEHRRFDHGFSLYDELIHVPLIIKVPGQVTGKVLREQTSSIDIMPTILDLLDIDLPETAEGQLSGRSLVGALEGRERKEDVYVETDYRRYTYKRALRSHDGWKFIHTMETGESELYDLRHDPSESRNLVAEEPRIAYELEQKLFRHLKSTGQDVHGPWIPGLYPVYASQAPDFEKK